MELTSRELLTHLYHSAIEAVDGRQLVGRWCQVHEKKYSHVIAIGKAAPAMLQGVLDSAPHFHSAFLVCPQRTAPRAMRKDKRILVHESSHPVPDASSLQAGEALLQFVRTLPEDARVLVLISGGASSLVEVLQAGLMPDDLQAINLYLLASGKNIAAINAWRRRFSRIKGGGLLNYLRGAGCTQLLLSDVRGDDASVIGSGLLLESDTVPDNDAYLHQFVDRTQYSETQDKHGELIIDTHIIGNQHMALLAAEDEAKHMGLACYLHKTFIDGDAVAQGARLGRWLFEQAPVGVHLWGAETTVTLPECPGMGGRNQSFALSLANTLHQCMLDAGREGDAIGVLAAGTDGIDGNTRCAGAVVFASTARQILQTGYDIESELANANAGSALMATADLFRTGPSGTNVMDLIIAWKQA
jgi:glycerate 2-kinase